MPSPDMNAYITAMTQIKLRIAIVNNIITGKMNLQYDVPTAEFCSLQLRMITETIVLASLSANKTLYEENQRKFCDHWHPQHIMSDIEKLNPDYFPIPINEMPAGDGRRIPEFLTRTEGCLSKAELIQVQGKCGNVLHAKNQFFKKTNADHYLKWTKECIGKIMKLLNTHKITLLEDDRFYLVQMHVGNEGSITYNEFVRKDRSGA